LSDFLKIAFYFYFVSTDVGDLLLINMNEYELLVWVTRAAQ